MILFIHGFGSCGWGGKSLALRRHFGVDEVIAPDLPVDPADAIAHLEGLVERYPVRALVGSSLGGFYATWLNRHATLPSVLINPAVRPYERLAAHVGRHRRWCDDLPFEIHGDFLDTLLALQRDDLGAAERYLVLLQTGDEVLDYRAAEAYYQGKTLRVIPGGSHRFDDFESELPGIAHWLGMRPAQIDA
jgi:predicted esterase YcpF (UPF0227 family)